jgi:NAD(P)H-dependent FMN reductase
MSDSAEYVVVSGGLRPASRSRILAQHLVQIYQERGVSAALLDLQALPLPICDGNDAYSDKNVAACSELLAPARVIIIATPIYNFDASAAVKNLVELTGEYWENKIVGFLCAAGGNSSYMSVMSLANSLMLDFRCVIIPRFVYATGEDFHDKAAPTTEIKERLAELAEFSTKMRIG